jgi:membrane dipeptidase
VGTSVTAFAALTEALLRRGYSETDVRKILGGNLLRVLQEVAGR